MCKIVRGARDYRLGRKTIVIKKYIASFLVI